MQASKQLVRALTLVAPVALSMLFMLPLLGGCEFSLPAGEAPPARSFYYPTALASGPGGVDSPYAYVVSSNFDQRYGGSWISVLDVAQLRAALEAPEGTGADPRDAVVDAVTIPSLAGRFMVNAASGVGFVGHRGRALLTAVEVAGGGAELSCGDAAATAGLSVAEQRSDCDDAHLVRLDAGAMGDDLESDDLLDPFATAFFDVAGESFVAVGYLSSPNVSVFGVGGGSAGAWLPHVNTQSVGVGGTGLIASFVSDLAPADTFLLAGKQSQTGETQAVYAIDAARLIGGGGGGGGGGIALGADLGPQLGSTEVSDVVFSPGGARVFAASASPAAVISLAATVSAPGTPAAALRLEPVDVLPLGGPPSALVYVERPDSFDLLVALSIEEDAAYFMRADHGVLRLVRRLDVLGEGPVAALPINLTDASDPPVVSRCLLVATFFDHGVTAIDISAADPLDFRTLGRVRNDAIPVAKRAR